MGRGQHDHAHARVGGRAVEAVRQLVEQAVGQRVTPLRVIEDQVGGQRGIRFRGQQGAGRRRRAGSYAISNTVLPNPGRSRGVRGPRPFGPGEDPVDHRRRHRCSARSPSSPAKSRTLPIVVPEQVVLAEVEPADVHRGGLSRVGAQHHQPPAGPQCPNRFRPAPDRPGPDRSRCPMATAAAPDPANPGRCSTPSVAPTDLAWAIFRRTRRSQRSTRLSGDANCTAMVAIPPPAPTTNIDLAGPQPAPAEQGAVGGQPDQRQGGSLGPAEAGRFGASIWPGHLPVRRRSPGCGSPRISQAAPGALTLTPVQRRHDHGPSPVSRRTRRRRADDMRQRRPVAALADQHVVPVQCGRLEFDPVTQPGPSVGREGVGRRTAGSPNLR